MANLSLSDDEVAVLVDILEGELSDIRMEIADTDSMMYKRKLRERKEILLSLTAKLREIPQLIRT